MVARISATVGVGVGDGVHVGVGSGLLRVIVPDQPGSTHIGAVRVLSVQAGVEDEAVVRCS